jgi:NADPH:quinone reductase-like Zn-dependent oxidoreductase
MVVPLGPVVTRHVRLLGITGGNRDDFTKMATAMELHTLEPVIERIFELEEFHGALDYLPGGRYFGKVCVRHLQKVTTIHRVGPSSSLIQGAGTK